MSTFLQQIVNGLSLGSIYALIALGYTMVYGVLRLINFAHGDVYMLGAFAGYYLSRKLRGDEPSLVSAVLVMIGSMLACAIVGVVIERFAYRPVRQASRLTLLITAIGVSLFSRTARRSSSARSEVLSVACAPRRLPPRAGAHHERAADGHRRVGAADVALHFFILRTRTGKAMRAVSFNLDAAKLMGITTDMIIAFTFALGSALAAAAGVLVGMPIPKIDPLMGIMSGLKAFVAAVLGGIGNIPGAVLGGLLIGVMEVMVVGYLSSTYRDAVAFGILILILLFRPQGILGRVQKEKV